MNDNDYSLDDNKDYFDINEASNRADFEYDNHRSALAHLSPEVRNKVNHLPTFKALEKGDDLEWDKLWESLK